MNRVLRAFSVFLLCCVAACSGQLGVPVKKQTPRRDPAQQDTAAQQQTAEQANAEGELADEGAPQPQTPFIRSLADRVEAAPGFEGKDNVLGQLDEADRAYSRIKQDNARALREAQRQVRVSRARSPNIVLFVASDLSPGDLGCYGQPRISTPNIDGLAKAGVRFTNFYGGSSNYELSRWTLMTGRSTRSVPAGFAGAVTTRAQTLAEMMWQAGYTTSIIGDCALAKSPGESAPSRHGFDEWLGSLDGTSRGQRFPEFLWHDGARIRLPANAGGARGQLATNVLMAEALSYLSRHRRGRPFFLWVAYPLVQADEDGSDLGAYADTQWLPEQKAHAAAISRMDKDFGRVIDRLQELQMDRQTAVFFTSQRPRGEAPQSLAELFGAEPALRSSADGLYEANLRVPLLARWPARFQKDAVSDRVCALWDLLPTLADTVGAAARPRGMDGRSFLLTLRGRAQGESPFLYWRGRQGGVAIRAGNWKLVRTAASPQGQLYNLQSDPSEASDLAAERAEIVDRIEALAIDESADDAG